jgi:hypothetical protein
MLQEQPKSNAPAMGRHRQRRQAQIDRMEAKLEVLVNLVHEIATSVLASDRIPDQQTETKDDDQ